MIQQKQPNIVKVSRSNIHGFINKKRRKLPIKRKKSNDINHAAIRNSQTSHFINKKASLTSNKEREVSKYSNVHVLKYRHSRSIVQSNESIKQNNSVVPISPLFSNVTYNESKQLNYKGTTNDYHQQPKKNKRKRCNRRCFILCLFITLLCILIGIIIPLVLLPKPGINIRKNLPINTTVLRWNTSGITIAGNATIAGTALNQLNQPKGIVLDYAYNLYIADYNNNRTVKYALGSSTGQILAGNGTAGLSPYQLYYPVRIILDSNGNYYISEYSNNRVQLWNNGASFGTTVAGTGSSGNSNNQLNGPIGIDLNPTSGSLYIADRYNNRIMSYASGVTNGILLFGGAGAGTNKTQLSQPCGLHFDSFSNSLIIANYGANNVVQYTLGSSSWTLIAGNINGSSGVTSTSLQGPFGVTLDPMGNVYVADRSNHRIQFFYSGQLNGTMIAGTGIAGNNTTTINMPSDVALDNQLNLYVADTYNNRIQKYLRY